MTLTSKTFLATCASLLLAPAAALAVPTVGDTLGTTVEEVASNLSAAGYQVREVDIDDDEVEAVVLAEGMLLELEISPETGMVTSVELEDDDEDDDDDDDDMGN